MNPRIFIACIVFACEMLAANMAHAQLFGRRSCNTGYCAPHVAHHVPAVVKERDFIQQLFFIAQNPGTLDTPRGTTGYGSLASALDVRMASDLDYLNDSRLHISASTDSRSSAERVAPGLHAIAQRQVDTNQIIAKGEAAASLVRSFSGESTAETRSIVLTLKNGQYESVREIKPDAEQEPQPRAFNGNVFAKLNCTGCHSGNQPKGDLDLTGDVSNEMLQLAIQRTTTADDAQLMPPAKDGHSRRLSPQKLQWLFDEANKRGLRLPEET